MGGAFSAAYYFNRYLGAQIEVGLHEYGKEVAGSYTGTKGNNDGFFTTSAGLIARFPMENITPFAHALVGGALVGGASLTAESFAAIIHAAAMLREG